MSQVSNTTLYIYTAFGLKDQIQNWYSAFKAISGVKKGLDAEMRDVCLINVKSGIFMMFFTVQFLDVLANTKGPFMPLKDKLTEM